VYNNRPKKIFATLIILMSTIQVDAQDYMMYFGMSGAYTQPVFNDQLPSYEEIDLDNGTHSSVYHKVRSNLGSGPLMNLHGGIKLYKQLFLEIGAGLSAAQQQRFFSTLQEKSGGGQIVNNEYRRLIENQHTFRFFYLAPAFIMPINDVVSIHMRTGMMVAQATIQSEIGMSLLERNSGVVQTSSANIRYDGKALPGVMMQAGAAYRIHDRVQINADFTFHAVSYRVEKVIITNRSVSGIPQPDVIFDYSGSTKHYSTTSSGYSPALSPQHMFSGAGIQLSVQFLFDKKNR
jgi:hypothetical protein